MCDVEVLSKCCRSVVEVLSKYCRSVVEVLSKLATSFCFDGLFVGCVGLFVQVSRVLEFVDVQVVGLLVGCFCFFVDSR